MKLDIKKIVILAMLAVIALTIFVAESFMPPLLPIPGIKLGLANIVTLIVIAIYGPADALCVLLVRIILGSIFGGQMISFFYSLAGGLLCLLAMTAMNRLFAGHFVIVTSMFGALAHNIGQIAVACIITQTAGVAAYLPILVVSGIITGCFTGAAAHFSIPYIRKLKARFDY